ncbi:hypothetical protein GEMRC1_013163 [Eukaryota sp. GEM-RC1]
MNERPKLGDIYESLNKLSEEFPTDCGSIGEELKRHVGNRSSAELENLNKQNSELSKRVLTLKSKISAKERELTEFQEFCQSLKNRVSKLELELQSSVRDDDSDSSKLPSAPPKHENTDSVTLSQQDSEIANSNLSTQISSLTNDIQNLTATKSVEITTINYYLCALLKFKITC